MSNGDGPTLERFRRVARNHRLSDLLSKGLAPEVEIDQIRSRINGLVFSEVQEWMLPHWAIKALQKANRTKTVEEGLTNNGYLNWLVIGGVGCRHYAISDSSGLVNPTTRCGSLDFWLQEPDGLLFPALQPGDGPRLRLISPEDQIYQWKHTIGPVEFSRLIYHATHDNQEFVYNEVNLRNMALEPSTFVFYLVLRPLSIKGFEPIESIRFNKVENILLSNDCPIVILDTPPSSIALTTLDNPNIPDAVNEHDRFDTEFNTAKGLATAMLRYQVTLPPAGTSQFLFMSPLTNIADDVRTFSPTPSARDVTVEEWFTLHDRAAIGEYPDRDLKRVITQARAALSIQTNSYLCPEYKTSLCLDWRERVRVLLALVRSGILDQSQLISSKFVRAADKQQEISDLNRLSALVWGTLQIYEHTQSQDYLRQIASFLRTTTLSLVNTIERYLENRKPKMVEPQIALSEEPPKMEEPDSEKPPPETTTPSLDIEGEGTHPVQIETPPPVEVKHIWTSEEITQVFWGYAALRSMDKALKMLDEDRHSEKIHEQLSALEELIPEVLAKHVMSELDAVDTFTLVTDAALLGLTEPYHDQLSTLLARGTEGLISKGLYREPQNPNRYSSHLALRLALFHCQTRHRSEAERLLQRALEFVSEFDFLPEWVNLRTRGGKDGSGCSLLAAADLLLLTREMVLFSDDEDLILLTGIPDEWFTSTFPLILDDIPTNFGPVHVEIGASANQYQIEVGMDRLPRELEVHVPKRLSLPMVKVYGAAVAKRSSKPSSPHLRIVPLSERVVLTFHK